MGTMDKGLEKDLMQRMKQGDQDAFQDLITAYHDLLFRTIYTKIQHVELAQDLTQDTFVKIWIKRQILRPEQSFFAILAKIGINLAQDAFRHRQVRAKYQDHVRMLSEKPAGNPQDLLEKDELEQQIAKTVAEDLPERCRLVFMLSRIEGYSNGEVAALLGISKKTVENQLGKAMKILRKKCGFNS